MKLNFIPCFVAATILFVGFGCAPTEQITSNVFTYSDVKVGQQYGAMTVEKVSSNNGNPISADNIHVEFTGTVTLIGILSAPTDNPEDGGMGPDYSLHALTVDSLKKMPILENDPRLVWFGIRNPEIIEWTNIKKGDRVELTISKYNYIFFPAGIWNEADAISVKKINDASAEIKESDQTVPTEQTDENLTSYSNDQLKISFSYPKEWGLIEEKTELPLIGQITLVFSDDIFLSASNGYRNADRGGYWGDYAYFLNDQSTITDFCKEPFTYPERIKSCAILTNNNGIIYAKTQEEICTEGGCSGLAVNYYLYNPNSEFRGLVISSDRLKDNNILELEEKLDELVNNLNFVK